MRRLLIIILIFVSANVFGQLLPNYGGQRSGLSTLSFLKNDVNPRSLSLGGASVAINYDGYSLFNNPALITSTNAFSAAASNLVVGAGVQQSFLSGVLPVKNSHFGLSINSLNSGAIEVRTEFQPYGTGELFYVSNNAIGLTYAKSLSDMFSMGLTIKYIYEQIAQYTNHTAAADLGFSYKTDFKDLRFAVMVQNFGGNSTLNGDFLAVGFNRDSASIDLNPYTVPTVFKMGLSMVPYKSEFHSVLVIAELNHPNDNAENFRIGAEYNYRDLLFARAGIKLSVEGQRLPSFGIGLRSRIGAHPLRIDYGVNPTNFFGMQHNFGLFFQFNKMER